ncbi:MAG: branched-chain amino acid ABC transporter permease [Thaumarchaeota archaeon]|nr:branched-chain amino acid ABC transporter permease [Nitrososphaerota archaeon]
MKTRIFNLFQRDRGIFAGAYGGYFRWTLIVMVILTPLFFFAGNGLLIQLIIIYSILALSYDFFSGYTGYYNLGFGAISAVGAYTFTFVSNAGVNVFVALLIAGIMGGIFALGISYPFLRLRGAYFAIATLALVLFLDIADINLTPYTGGEVGLHVFISTQIASYNGSLLFLLGTLLLLLACLSVHFTIGRSRLGLALRSIREEEDVSESYGVNAFRIKQIVLLLSGFFGGLGGAVFAIYFGFINPDNVLGLSTALLPVVASMIGGPGIFLGPLVGGFVLEGINLTLPTYIDTINPSYNFIGPLVVTGVLLLIVGLFLPTGIVRLRFLQKYMYRNPDRFLTLRRRATTTETETKEKH